MLHSIQRWGLLAALIALVTIPAGTARAFYIEADLPIGFNFSDKNVNNPDSTSGILLTLGGLVAGLGVGYEHDSATWKATGGGKSAVIDFDYLQIVWSPPIPVVNFTVGAGFGSASPNGSLSGIYDQGDMTEFLVRVGLPIAKLFDVHVGYEMFSGKAPGHPLFVGGVNVTPKDVTLDGTLTTVGVRVGF